MLHEELKFARDRIANHLPALNANGEYPIPYALQFIDNEFTRKEAFDLLERVSLGAELGRALFLRDRNNLMWVFAEAIVYTTPNNPKEPNEHKDEK